MSLRSSEIALLAAELAPLAGARVDGVRVHGERSLTLELRGPAGEATVLVSAEPGLARVHVATWRPPPPDDPLPFQAVLRRELSGARLLAVEAPAGGRVVLFRFERGAGAERAVGAERADGAERTATQATLVAELSGRDGNVLLLDGEGTVRAVAGRNLSPRRVLVPGARWTAPEIPPESAARLEGVAQREAAPAAGGAALPAPVPGRFPLSAAVEARYRLLEEERALAAARRRLREPVRAAVARSRRALDKIADEAARVPAAEDDRRAADLLKQNLHAVPRGAREVTLTEWSEEGARPRTLALDPALTPRANMERLYRRYRRIVESAARVAARAAEVRDRLAALEALLAELEAAPQEALPRLEREARRLGAAPRPQRAPVRRRRADEEPALPYRAFRSRTGLPILVGKGAAENDQLTVRVAKGNDLWLHVRGRPGAHVVLRLPKGRAPDQESLLDAAHLAAWFSDGRGEAAPEVVYTRAKHVRKVKGAAPGSVTYSQERALALRVEPGRVERLLAAEEEEGG